MLFYISLLFLWSFVIQAVPVGKRLRLYWLPKAATEFWRPRWVPVDFCWFFYSVLSWQMMGLAMKLPMQAAIRASKAPMLGRHGEASSIHRAVFDLVSSYSYHVPMFHNVLTMIWTSVYDLLLRNREKGMVPCLSMFGLFNFLTPHATTWEEYGDHQRTWRRQGHVEQFQTSVRMFQGHRLVLPRQSCLLWTSGQRTKQLAHDAGFHVMSSQDSNHLTLRIWGCYTCKIQCFVPSLKNMNIQIIQNIYSE